MKPARDRDYRVHVRPERWEHPQHAAHYAGIYEVTLNDLVHVRFVPVVALDPWPPALPADFDEPMTPVEARLFAVATSRYTVVPDAAHPGTERQVTQIPAGDEPAPDGTVYFVHPDEFQILSRELEDLGAEVGAVGASKPVSQLGDSPVARVLARVISSASFLPEDRSRLGR